MRKFLLFFALLLSVLCLTQPIFALDIELSSGWNLITVPVDSTQPVSAFLAGKLFSGGNPVENIDAAVRRIWSYDNNSWLSYADGAGSLENFKSNMGYWFYMAQAAVLRIDDSSFSLQNLEIKSPGWALVGLGNKQALSFADEIFSSQFLSSNHIAGNVPRVWGYRSVGGWSSFQTVPSMSGTTSAMNPGQGYWFYARNVDEHVINAETPLLISFEQQLTIPAVPTGVNAVFGDKQVIINWSPVSGATEYRIYSSSSPGVTTADTVMSVSGGSSSSGTISSLTNGTNYYFSVQARNMAGFSPLSLEVSAVPQDSGGVDSGKVILKSAVGGAGRVVLSWGAIAGASSYRIYYKDSVGVTDTSAYITFDSVAEGVLTTALTGLSYGKIWSFAVQAFNNEGAMGSLSNELRSAPLYAIRPSNLNAGTHNYNLDYLHEGADVYFVFSNSSTTVSHTGGISVSPQNNISPSPDLNFSINYIQNQPAELSLSERIALDNRRIAAELTAQELTENNGRLLFSEGSIPSVTQVGSVFSFECTDGRLEPITLRAYSGLIATNNGNRALRIWVADNLWHSGGSKVNLVTQEMVDVLQNKFLQAGADNDIYDWVTNVFGAEWGEHEYANLLSPTGIIDIVLKDIENDNNTTGGTTFGYFWAANNYTDSVNKMIAFVIDGLLFATKEEESTVWSVHDYFPGEIISTISHEFQHMIHFYQHLGEERENKETWLDELLSMSAEDMLGDKIFANGPRGVKYDDYTAGSSGILNGRLPLFNEYNSNSLITWVTSPADRLYSEYSSSYAFGAYLLRNYGVEVLKNIYAASEPGMGAVVTAVSSITGNRSLGVQELLERWGASVLFSDSTQAPFFMRYNSGYSFVSRLNDIKYQLGSINLYNYKYENKTGPRINLTLATDQVYPQMSNTYYLATTGVTGGSFNCQVELSSGISVTAVIKDVPVTAQPEIALVHIPSGSVYRDSEGSSIINTREFYLGKYEITQGEWQAVTGSNPSYFSACGSTCPVENVNWNTIVGDGGFLDKLNNKAGCTSPGILHETPGAVRYHPDNVPPGCFRLPTLDELEYAQRAGSNQNYHWGIAEDAGTAGLYARYRDNISVNSPEPVGQKLPNLWGIYDTSGNVYEWTYTEDESGVYRLMHGGDWYGELTDQRSAHYFAALPSYAGTNQSGDWLSVGLRVLRVSGASGDRVLLPPSSAVTATAMRTGVFVNWAASPGASSYRVYYSQNPGVSSGSASVSVSGGVTSVTVSGLTENISYYFRVEAGNVSGQISRLSAEVSARTQAIVRTVQGIELSWIPAGTVNCTTVACGNGSGSIKITTDFYLGKYPLTQGQWEDVMGVENWPGTAPSSYGSGDLFPMYYVSWNDINMKDGFLDKLNIMAGCDISGLDEATATRYNPAKVPAGCFRLPTADEAEYAHRAGTGTYYYWGDDDSAETVVNYAWYEENNSQGNWGTKAVGQKNPNAWGLYDMSGNVFECTYTVGGDQTGEGRLIRGGYWLSSPGDLRSSVRYYVPVEDRANNQGLRLLLVNE